MEQQDELETQPLLDPNQEETCRTRKKYVNYFGIVAITCSFVVACLYLLIYCWYVPKSIRVSMSSVGPNITSIVLYSLSPILMQVNLRIPMNPPKPCRILIDFPSSMVLIHDSESTIEDETSVALIEFGGLDIPKNAPFVDNVSNTTVSQLNLPWISWYLSQAGKYGLDSMDLKL